MINSSMLFWVMECGIHKVMWYPLLQTIGLLKNALKGKVLCKLHTDKWPLFSTLICEVFHPRVSEVGSRLQYTLIN